MTSQTYDTSLSADPQETGWGVLRTVLGKKDNSQEIQNPNNGVTSLARVITSQRPRPLTLGKKNTREKNEMQQVLKNSQRILF